MFHARDGWFFERSGTAVKIIRVFPPTNELRDAIVLSAEEWASVVASVSAAGDTLKTWEQALNFHTPRQTKKEPD